MLHQATRRYAVLCALAFSIVHVSAEDADGNEAIKDDVVEAGAAVDKSVAAEATTDEAATNDLEITYLYGGGNLGWATQSETLVFGGQEFVGNTSLVFSHGRFGMEFNEYISWEFRLGSGGGLETIETHYFDPIDFRTRRIKVDVTTSVLLVGGYVRAGIPMEDAPLYPYGVIGLTIGAVTAETWRASARFPDADVSFGVGVDWRVWKGINVNVEYTSYFSTDSIQISGFSAGILIRKPFATKDSFWF